MVLISKPVPYRLICDAGPTEHAHLPKMQMHTLGCTRCAIIRFCYWRYAVEKLLRYIETTEQRNKIIDVLDKFCIVGATILTVVVLWAKYF